MKTLVMGASHKPHRYSNMAVNLLKEYGHEVVAQGRRAQQVDDWEILKGTPSIEELHTITLYLNADNQQEYYDYILGLNAERVIFNPGAENRDLKKKLEEKGVETVEGCTLVMLRTHQF